MVEKIYEKLQIEINGNKINLNHHPYQYAVGKYDTKFLPIMPKDDGSWLLHAHIHSNEGSWKIRDRMMNYTVDLWNYTPFSEIKISKIIEQKQQ